LWFELERRIGGREFWKWRAVDCRDMGDVLMLSNGTYRYLHFKGDSCVVGPKNRMGGQGERLERQHHSKTMLRLRVRCVAYCICVRRLTKADEDASRQELGRS